MAQVWAMVCGRGAAGGQSAQRELTRWAEHALIADDGWSSSAAGMDDLYRQPNLDRDQIANWAATSVRQPIIARGRRAWSKGP